MAFGDLKGYKVAFNLMWVLLKDGINDEKLQFI